MSGSTFALCIDPFLRLLVWSLVDLVRLTACTDDLATVFAKRWACLRAMVADFVRWASASGLAVSVAKCVPAARRCFTDVEAEFWLGASCPVAGSSRERPLLGGRVRVRVGPGSRERQWSAVVAKLLRRVEEVVNEGEALYRAQFCALDAHSIEGHRQAVQRLCAAPWMAFPPDLLQGPRSLGLPSAVPKLQPLVAAARRRASSKSGVKSGAAHPCVAEFAAVLDSDDALLDHLVRF